MSKDKELKTSTIQRHNLCMSDAAPFNQHWEARLTGTLEGADVGAALQPCISSVKPGDLVNVTAYEDYTWSRMTEVQSFRVVAVSDKVEVLAVSKLFSVPADKPKVDEGTTPVKYDVVEENGSWVVKDHMGKDVESFTDKVQAEAFKIREEGRAKRKSVAA
jgi:hypothetical protein